MDILHSDVEATILNYSFIYIKKKSFSLRTQSAVQSCQPATQLNNRCDRVEAGTHQGGGSCYSRSRAARPPALEAAPRLCLHHHQPAEEASRHLQPNRSMPPWSSGEPEAPGFRIGCYPRGGGAHRPQAEGRRRRPSRGDGGGQQGVEC